MIKLTLEEKLIDANRQQESWRLKSDKHDLHLISLNFIWKINNLDI